MTTRDPHVHLTPTETMLMESALENAMEEPGASPQLEGHSASSVAEDTRGLLAQVQRRRMVSLTDRCAIAIVTAAVQAPGIMPPATSARERRRMRGAATRLCVKLSEAAGEPIAGFPD